MMRNRRQLTQEQAEAEVAANTGCAKAGTPSSKNTSLCRYLRNLASNLEDTGEKAALLNAADEIEHLEQDGNALRAIFPKILEALGNGAACKPECSVEFLSEIPREVKLVTDQLRNTIRTLLASAHPHPMENGAMYEAWESARKTLKQLSPENVNSPSDARLVRFELTHEQAKALSDALWDYRDCGPTEEGWASEEVHKLRGLIDDAIEKFKPNDQTDQPQPFDAPPCSPIDFNHPEFWVGKCPKCGWIGMSNDAAGGEAIADTGDYGDVICPRCFGDPATDECECVPLEDAYPEDLENSDVLAPPPQGFRHNLKLSRRLPPTPCWPLGVMPENTKQP